MTKELEAVKKYFAGLTLGGYRRFRHSEGVLGAVAVDEHGFSLYCIEKLGGRPELKAVLLALEKEKPAIGIKPIIDLANERAKEVFREKEERREQRLVRWVKRKPALLFSHLRNLLATFNKEDYKGRSRGAFVSFLMDVIKEQGYMDIACKAGISPKDIKAMAVERADIVYHSGNGASMVYSAKDIISNKLWAGKIKPNSVLPIQADDSGGYGSIVKFQVNGDTLEIRYRKYGEYERRVSDAVATLWRDRPFGIVPYLIDSLQIYRTMTHNSKAKLTERIAKEIAKAMLNCGNGEMTIVTDPSGDKELWDSVEKIRTTAGKSRLKPERELKKYSKLPPMMYGHLITFTAESSGEFEGVLDRWYISACPILHDYAGIKGQVASVELQVAGKLEARRGKSIIAVSGYLDRQIATMKNDKNFSRNIKWDNLYELDNSTTSKEKTKNPKQSQGVMQQRTRAKVCKLLDERVKAGIIKGYTYKEKSNMKQVGKRWKYSTLSIIL